VKPPPATLLLPHQQLAARAAEKAASHAHPHHSWAAG
jgi:hypothetical protein